MRKSKTAHKLERRYSLEELSVRWNKPISTLREWIRTVQFNQVGAAVKIDGRVAMISLFFKDKKGSWKHRGTHATDQGPHDIVVNRDPHELFDGLVYNDNEKPFIHEKEVLRFERERNLGSKQDTIPSNLSQSKGIVFPHLQIANEAHEALYVRKQIKSHRGHKDQIKEWLKKEYPDLSPNARNTIATIVNAKKDGGAPPPENKTYQPFFSQIPSLFTFSGLSSNNLQTV
jgi:hypothetical protein